MLHVSKARRYLYQVVTILYAYCLQIYQDFHTKFAKLNKKVVLLTGETATDLKLIAKVMLWFWVVSYSSISLFLTFVSFVLTKAVHIAFILALLSANHKLSIQRNATVEALMCSSFDDPKEGCLFVLLGITFSFSLFYVEYQNFMLTLSWELFPHLCHQIISCLSRYQFTSAI